MNRQRFFLCVACCLCFAATATAQMADTFGTGVNQFTIDFVAISGDTNPASGIPAGQGGFLFTGVNNDYRMGVYEITNAQWGKFTASLGVPVTGNPSSAYDASALYTGADVPTNEVSWYEAAQMVNWLNTSTGHHAAYKFTGTQGEGDYALATWSVAEAAGGTNLYRHKDAFYFLPTEDEWVKAAYWNGTTLQTYATKAGESLYEGDGTNGGWNYYGERRVDPWNVGSGSEELNGTFEMMGNVHEWVESPASDPNYGTGSYRVQRGGSFGTGASDEVDSSSRLFYYPTFEAYSVGFRVASVPEPVTVGLLAVGAAALLRRKR